MMNNKINWIKGWVEELEKQGKICFSFEDILEAFPNHNGQVVKNALTRLTRKGKILSVWKGFYLIIPLQYYSIGILPPNMFIDQLMKHMNKDYYVCLLNAVAIFGSAHQSPQTYSVMIKPPSLRSTTKKNDLWNKIQKCGLKLRTVPLRNRKSVTDCPINKKWKVIINTQIEID